MVRILQFFSVLDITPNSQRHVLIYFNFGYTLIWYTLILEKDFQIRKRKRNCDSQVIAFNW